MAATRKGRRCPWRGSRPPGSRGTPPCPPGLGMAPASIVLTDFRCTAAATLGTFPTIVLDVVDAEGGVRSLRSRARSQDRRDGVVVDFHRSPTWSPPEVVWLEPCSPHRWITGGHGLFPVPGVVWCGSTRAGPASRSLESGRARLPRTHRRWCSAANARPRVREGVVVDVGRRLHRVGIIRAGCSSMWVTFPAAATTLNLILAVRSDRDRGGRNGSSGKRAGQYPCAFRPAWIRWCHPTSSLPLRGAKALPHTSPSACVRSFMNSRRRRS